jgi:hypothetical protein
MAIMITRITVCVLLGLAPGLVLASAFEIIFPYSILFAYSIVSSRSRLLVSRNGNVEPVLGFDKVIVAIESNLEADPLNRLGEVLSVTYKLQPPFAPPWATNVPWAPGSGTSISPVMEYDRFFRCSLQCSSRDIKLRGRTGDVTHPSR